MPPHHSQDSIQWQAQLTIAHRSWIFRKQVPELPNQFFSSQPTRMWDHRVHRATDCSQSQGNKPTVLPNKDTATRAGKYYYDYSQKEKLCEVTFQYTPTVDEKWCTDPTKVEPKRYRKHTHEWTQMEATDLQQLLETQTTTLFWSRFTSAIDFFVLLTGRTKRPR